MRQIEYIGELIEIDSYEDKHRPENQTDIREGVCINPALRDHFDATPNELREDLELVDWWDRPYIRAVTWEEMKPHNATPDEIEKHRLSWLESFPEGIRYDVRCLDGGAWDRSTWWGTAKTLTEALEITRTGPEWRRRQ